MSVDEVYDTDDVYNDSDNNTALLCDTCVDSFPLAATFSQKDNKNDTWCIPNRKLINEAIILPESPIELKKRKSLL